MKKLLLLSLIASSFSTLADGHHLMDFTLSDFCYTQPNVQYRDGAYYFPNQSVGITDTSICVYKDEYGQYSSKGNIVRGFFDGLWTGWTRNGEIWLESYYINRKVVPIVCRDDLLEFDKDETYYDSYNNLFTGYNRCSDEDRASIKGEIINGKREGFWSAKVNRYYIDANYKNGKFDGLVQESLQDEFSTTKGFGPTIYPKTDENYKNGKCISSNIRNLENNGYAPCSRKDVDTTTIM